jgi:hypothetical protein
MCTNVCFLIIRHCRKSANTKKKLEQEMIIVLLQCPKSIEEKTAAAQQLR